MNNYILVTKYWYWLIAVGVFLLLFLITNLALLYYRKKKILANLSDFCDKKGYRLTVVKRKTYDYIIEVGEKNFFIKTAFVPLKDVYKRQPDYHSLGSDDIAEIAFLKYFVLKFA